MFQQSQHIFLQHPRLTQDTRNSLLGALLNALWWLSSTAPLLALILCCVEWEMTGCFRKMV